MFGCDELSDELVSSAASGNEAARERLLCLLSDQVRGMVIARLSPVPFQFHAVDDLVQQSLLGVVAGLPGLKTPIVSTLRAFASTIVSRRVADYLAKPPPGVAARSLDSSVFALSGRIPLGDLLPASQRSPRTSLARIELIQTLIDELGKMQPQYRDILTLAFFDQLPVAQIAERLKMKRPAASMLLLRAVKSLRRTLTGSSKLVPGDGQ